MKIELLHRKDRIILTTIEIIDELGIHGLSTREIAKRQGISEGAIFRHFKTKNDIILGVLEHFSKYDQDIFHSAKMKGLNPKDAIRFFVDSFATYYENYPAITAMTQMYDALSYEPEFAAEINKIYTERVEFLKQTVEDGQSKGDFDPSYHSELLANIINGSFREICLSWRMSNHSFSLRDKALAAVDMVIAAFTPKA